MRTSVCVCVCVCVSERVGKLSAKWVFFGGKEEEKEVCVYARYMARSVRYG